MINAESHESTLRCINSIKNNNENELFINCKGKKKFPNLTFGNFLFYFYF